MKKIRSTQFLLFVWSFVVLFLVPGATAALIDQSTITEVVKQVNVIEVAGKRQKPAKPQDIFRTPDIMRTASESRAEMIAPDQTVTRIGANTVFSFSQNSREINLDRGSVLFSSPSGKGGGRVKTVAATASVLGTTIIVAATKNGGFKLLVLEGHGKATLSNGKVRFLKAGQLVFILPGSKDFGPAYEFHLSEQVAVALLVKGFKNALPSMAKIQAAIKEQEHEIATGQLVSTSFLVGEGGQPIDPNLRQNAIAVLTKTQQVTQAVIAPFMLALAIDATVSASLLDPSHLFPFTLSNVQSVFGTQPPLNLLSALNYNGFFANNTSVTAPSVSLASFNTATPFAFISLGNFTIPKGVALNGLTNTPLFFLVGGAFSASGNVQANTSGGVTFLTGLSGGAPFSLSNGTLANSAGAITIDAPSYVSSNESINASGSIDITARSGGISLANGTTYSSNTSIRLAALGDINVNQVNFNAASIALEARTLILYSINFPGGSQVTLASQFGKLAPNPNTAQKPLAGFVNFVGEVSYNFNTINASNASTFIGQGKPINIIKR